MAKNEDLRINQDIKSAEVRLVGETGEQLGVVFSREALNMATDASLDLVEISPTAKPPVCKIMDYGRYRFELKKKKKDQEKKNRAARVELKELWLRPNIDVHDIDIKIKHAKEFLEKGDKVKFTVKFRGRELSHKEKGAELLTTVLEKLGEDINIDQQAKQAGRQMTLIVSPK